DLVEAMHECGVRSLPIVAVTSLLFGLILAFVGAVQLSMFGAQIYVAGLVGIGMLRVMGAVMVGIVMSGRVGAAFAALIGTMQVNEEIDALETMGIPPIDYLVLPRMLALSVMVPLLTVFADAMGIAGGFFVAITMLDLTPMQYLTATVDMVSYKQGIVGLVYATVFGIIIAIAGCYHGMRCGRSAQAVGEATTTAVVHSIVGIIVASAVITVICNVLQI
ncbi:MAG: ABC transporter permease, partial [Desulfovibrio sp.]|nr:ABC transporter permease [Desulfovibrio sp.]